MACWFYGLAHELGHFVGSRVGRDCVERHSDDDLLGWCRFGARSQQSSRERRRRGAIVSPIESAGHILAPDTLRDEVRADLFCDEPAVRDDGSIARMIADAAE
jgi:hypothetical protein